MNVYGVQTGYVAFTPNSGGRYSCAGAITSLVRIGTGIFNVLMPMGFVRPEWTVTPQLYATGGGEAIVTDGTGFVEPVPGNRFFTDDPLSLDVTIGMTLRIPGGVDNPNNRVILEIDVTRTIVTVGPVFDPQPEFTTFDVVTDGAGPGISVLPIPAGIQVRTYSNVAEGTLDNLPWEMTVTRQPPTGGAFPVTI